MAPTLPSHPTSSFQNLPDLVLFLILPLLSVFDLLNLSATCARIRAHVYTEFERRFRLDAVELKMCNELRRVRNYEDEHDNACYTEDELRSIRKHLGLCIQQLRFFPKVNYANWIYPETNQVSLFASDYCVNTAITLRTLLLSPDVLFNGTVAIEGFANHMIGSFLFEDQNNFVKIFMGLHHLTLKRILNYINFSHEYLSYSYPEMTAIGLRFPSHQRRLTSCVKALMIFLNDIYSKSPKLEEVSLELSSWGYFYSWGDYGQGGFQSPSSCIMEIMLCKE